MSAITTAIAIPIVYIEKTIVPEIIGKKTPATNTYTGSLAAHDISGLIRMVVSLFDLPSIVRVAITAGTVQPKPSSNGMNDFP